MTEAGFPGGQQQLNLSIEAGICRGHEQSGHKALPLPRGKPREQGVKIPHSEVQVPREHRTHRAPHPSDKGHGLESRSRPTAFLFIQGSASQRLHQSLPNVSLPGEVTQPELILLSCQATD